MEFYKGQGSDVDDTNAAAAAPAVQPEAKQWLFSQILPLEEIICRQLHEYYEFAHE
jgi:hypothetical protein